jgi:hypothetical protein
MYNGFTDEITKCEIEIKRLTIANDAYSASESQRLATEAEALQVSFSIDSSYSVTNF